MDTLQLRFCYDVPFCLSLSIEQWSMISSINLRCVKDVGFMIYQVNSIIINHSGVF